MRHFAVTLGFAPAKILRAGIKRYYETASLKPECHVLFDDRYPLNPEQVRNEMDWVEDRYDLTQITEGENLGLHRAFNAATKWIDDNFHLEDQDVIIAYDADSYPVESGWDKAIFDLMESDPQLGICSLWNEATSRETNEKNFDEHPSGKAILPHGPTVITVAGWRWGFLKRAGGWWEPRAYYGHLEGAMWPRMEQNGYRWAFLKDFHEDNGKLKPLQDLDYRLYKWVHSHLDKFKGSFAEFIAAGCPRFGTPPDKPDLNSF